MAQGNALKSQTALLQNQSIKEYKFTSTDGQTNFPLAEVPLSRYHIFVSINGQLMDTDDYFTSNNIVIFNTALPADQKVRVVEFLPFKLESGNALAIEDNSFPGAKLQSLSVTVNKLNEDVFTYVENKIDRRIGSSLRFELEYIPIAPEFPWFCMSLPTQTLTTANFPQSFIDVLRNKKVVYGELGTNVSAFTGTWSGSEFTLDNNAANVAMIAELAEEWLFEKAMRGGVDPTDGWRILVSGGSEYNITNIVTSTRKITVSGSPSGTSIEIYLNRILGSTTSAKHFSWAGLGLYMTGQNKITGLRRRDKFQAWQLGATDDDSGTRNLWARAAQRDFKHSITAFTNATEMFLATSNQGTSTRLKAMSDGTNGDPRPGSKTEMESGTIMVYMYTGGYTA